MRERRKRMVGECGRSDCAERWGGGAPPPPQVFGEIYARVCGVVR